ncbi:MAG: transglycosylase SLT domain-containing protein [Nitrospinae bacterium]|nr:transglycosylase SLT domain-containing protein [Nitrospinota bacterium]
MKSLIRLVSLVSLVSVVLGSFFLVTVGLFKVRARESTHKIESLEKAIFAQHSWNGRHKTRIRIKSRMIAVLSNFGGSMHHDPAQMAELILSNCERNDLDPFIILGMIKAESDFNSRAVSSEGAMGLMQIKPATASLLEPYADFGPTYSQRLISENDLNITLGTMYLAKLVRRFGNLDMALEAYNKGPDGMLTLLSTGADDEMGYSGRVKANSLKYKNWGVAQKNVKRGVSS